ncbi:calmodulin-like [Haliotis rubra]|uniref:calmodulin-like n=1 Tax=Haliotis rubra TaxID=36100 RepID=UPI001EE50EAB|nr:calmodulin-like [Haliotis rubra]
MFTIVKNEIDGNMKYHILAPDEVEAYNDIFKVFDEGGKGYLTASDFSRVGNILHTSNADTSDVCSSFDINGDGKVTLDELLTVVTCMNQKANTETEMSHVFRLLDKNSDGCLDKEELKQLMTSLGKQLSEKEVDELIMKFDSDLDGRLQYGEFVKMLSS